MAELEVGGVLSVWENERKCFGSKAFLWNRKGGLPINGRDPSPKPPIGHLAERAVGGEKDDENQKTKKPKSKKRKTFKTKKHILITSLENQQETKQPSLTEKREILRLHATRSLRGQQKTGEHENGRRFKKRRGKSIETGPRRPFPKTYLGSFDPVAMGLVF